MQFLRRRGSDLGYRVEVSVDLATWRWNGDATGLIWTTESVTEVNADFDSVVIAPGAPLVGAAKIFYRINVTSP